jgi:type I restriction enzyme S subunit
MSLKKISDLFNFEKGSLQSTKCVPGEYNFITASSEWKTHNEYTHECEALIFAAAASGSLGRIHYVNGKFISSDLCFIITPKDPDNYPIDIKFYHLIFETFKEDIVKNTKAGTSKEAIGLKSFGNYKLPYFEINKQIFTREQFVNAQISKTELVSEFSHQLGIVKQLRQAFLKEAMQGKLTAKWRKENPDIEPASKLLAKIKAEKEKLVKEGKLKKQKPLPAIKEDEIPFEIPESWEWCRLGEIINFGPSNGFSPIESKKGTGIKCLTLTATTSGRFKEGYYKFVVSIR